MAKTLTLDDLAEALGRSKQAINRNWIKHADWPFGRGPWKASDVPRMREWAAEALREDRSTDEGKDVASAKGSEVTGKITLARLQKMLRDIQEADLRIQEKKGELHNVAECEREQRERARFTKQAILDRLPSTAAQEIDAKQRAKNGLLGVVDLREIIRDHAATIHNEYVAKAGG